MSVKELVFQKVSEIKGVDPAGLTSETTFLEVGADSLDMVEFSMDIENAFGITVNEKDISGIKTLGQAIDFIESRKK
jgi:acyl carrier protein